MSRSDTVNFTRRFIFQLGVFFCLSVLLSSELWASLPNSLKSHLGPGNALILAAPSGRVIFSVNPEKPMVPASTLKVVTALAALHYLGFDYRFKTDFFLDAHNNLIIKGYGDPTLTSKAVAGICRELKKRLPAAVNTINDIVLDDSFFSEPLTIPGINASIQPYDAPNGALCVNFNTVSFQQNKNGRYISGEPETPLLPFVKKRVKASGLPNGRIPLSHRNREAIFYAGHLFRYFLTASHVPVAGAIRIDRTNPENHRLILQHGSEQTLSKIIAGLMEYSNNFTANQILITTGAAVYGSPGTLENGVEAVTTYAKSTLGLSHTRIVEGSGISRKNRMSATDLLTALEAFAPHAGLLRKKGREYYKTGTLNGIRTRVGYIENRDGRHYRFVVLINSGGKSIEPVMTYLKSWVEKNGGN